MKEAKELFRGRDETSRIRVLIGLTVIRGKDCIPSPRRWDSNLERRSTEQAESGTPIGSGRSKKSRSRLPSLSCHACGFLTRLASPQLFFHHDTLRCVLSAQRNRCVGQRVDGFAAMFNHGILYCPGCAGKSQTKSSAEMMHAWFDRSPMTSACEVTFSPAAHSSTRVVV